MPVININSAAEEELNELKRLNRDVEKMLLFGTYEYDLASGAIKWSDGVFNILGCETPMDYATFISHIIREDFGNIDDRIKTQLLSQKEYNEDYEIKIDETTKKIIQIIGRRTHDEYGMVIKDIGIIKDISKEKEQEEIANKVINELIRSNKELESFAYIASHDLQEPLRKISTFSDRLASKLAEKLNEEESMYLRRILASTENMRLLIDNLLEYSRISRDNTPFTDTNLNFILQQVKTDLELVIEESGTIVTSDKLPIVQALPARIKQLLNNIIGNSIKFKKPGLSPEIAITSSILDVKEKKHYKLYEGKTYYKIVIKDNGIGFEEEYSLRIFQIFQRLHGKSEYPGSGIGLAICKKIVEQHNGVIFANGILGVGTTITIILPEKQ